jgi:Arc/MetJ-type ribon-helix-helix transcriptional regulator
MIQSKFTISNENARFLDDHRRYGFKDKSEAVRSALDKLSAHLLLEQLRASAQAYSEIYENDEETREWLESASEELPG